MPSRCEICCEILIAILLPPVGVCLRHGCCSVSFFFFFNNFFKKFVNTNFCLVTQKFPEEIKMCYIPGIIYALYAIVFVDRDEYFDEYRRPLYYSA
ncbi:hypothetical protein FEM48_Zijuj01G0171100 [Ziziphus jujuba var. spinosa]|uniref:Secreted protein n=1 Tax=Ziziphus jujuba var. spinosa TaxID=714518 RepID=A0A978W2H7_ZIZJJ|nr:hypothetical protein FEM48_Zijuj01G0171100 [Ziziphus jujuba var. spinosa]